MRNIKQAAAQGREFIQKNSEQEDIQFSEYQQLQRAFDAESDPIEAIMDLILDSFYFGVEIGRRAEQKH